MSLKKEKAIGKRNCHGCHVSIEPGTEYLANIENHRGFIRRTNYCFKCGEEVLQYEIARLRDIDNDLYSEMGA